MNTYRTGEIAQHTGLHSNTKRFYEEIGFISKPDRLPNGYRVYTQMHLEQVGFIRLALRAEVLQGGLRALAAGIIRLCAAQEFQKARQQTQAYIRRLDRETSFAKGAVQSVEDLLQHRLQPAPQRTRSEAANALGITVDTLRNWERNGLVSVRRMQNGYRVYEAEDMQLLLIIRTLRCANYSLSAILRLTGSLLTADDICVAETLNNPADDEQIVSACDHLLSALAGARDDAAQMLRAISRMEKLKTLQ